jgi:NAD+ synthase
VTGTTGFAAGVLHIDAARVADRIRAQVREQVLGRLRRRGVVVGLSGGVDSSVVAALCVGALGADRVVGIFMPEEDSDPESLRLGRMVADALGIATLLEDIGPQLRAAGCYERREGFIRQVVPEYGPGYRCKLELSHSAVGGGYNLSSLVVQAPDGTRRRTRLPLPVYLGIVAATNMKQRTRKQVEYYHADRLHYAVAGTPNRLEYDQGFFVKNGDGSADLKPIAHLYKSQVIQLAEHLGVPAAIRGRTPTTDTYSMPQTQEEFYFSLPYGQLDLCLYGLNHGVAATEVAEATGLTSEQVERVYRDIRGKRRATRYQHERPLLVELVPEVETD